MGAHCSRGITCISTQHVTSFTMAAKGVRFPKFVDPSEISEVMFTPEQINDRVKALGAEISESYKGIEKPLVLVGTLKGATPFFADLAR